MLKRLTWRVRRASQPPHTHQREGEEGEEGEKGGGVASLDVVYAEPRYGMHVGVFSAVHGGPNAV